MSYSNCCGASPRNEFEEEAGICSDCGEHCNYEEEEDYVKSLN